MPSSNSKKKAVIIGSGMGGLAAAIRLAVQGFQVSVYEKNNEPGGKLGWFQQDGYSFDSGPSLFTQPENIEELFKLANENIYDYFSYKKTNETCRYFFANGKQIIAPSQPEVLAQVMHQQLGEDPIAVKKYLTAAQKSYQNIGRIFLEFPLQKFSTFFHSRTLKALLSLRFSFLTKSLHNYNQSIFKTQEAIQIFDRYATYNGSNPYQAPAMLSMIPHLEMNQGSFYPTGGMISITKALYQLALKKGVQFFFNKTVEKILYQKKKVNGILVEGKSVDADIVVSNGDVYFTYLKLLNQEINASKILKQERSSSAFIFYWGIKKSFPQLGLHNIFFSENYQQEFNKIFIEKNIFTDPTIYINITCKMENMQAPTGKENWFVMINVPANTGQNWETFQQNAKQNIIKKLSKILNENIENLIETETILNPILIEKNTQSFMGSLYGTSSNTTFAAFLRHKNWSQKIKGLYFVGGSVHPGGGIPLCLKSAKIMASLVQKDFKN